MLINQAKKEPIMIERHEKEAAVLISVEQFEKLLEAQELKRLCVIPSPVFPGRRLKKNSASSESYRCRYTSKGEKST
jgi:PHD/YefM family antitoxin component YafN of YafNO toxin-antitoxin module